MKKILEKFLKKFKKIFEKILKEKLKKDWKNVWKKFEKKNWWLETRTQNPKNWGSGRVRFGSYWDWDYSSGNPNKLVLRSTFRMQKYPIIFGQTSVYGHSGSGVYSY